MLVSAGAALDGTKSDWCPSGPGKPQKGGREGPRLQFLKSAGWEICSLLYTPSAPTKLQTSCTAANVPLFWLPAHEDENSDLAKAAVARPKGKVRARNHLEGLLCWIEGLGD